MCKLTQKDIYDFDDAVRNLAKAKKIELELRKKIINHFRYNGSVEGVQHKSFEGIEADIAITLKLNRTLDKDALQTLWVDLTEGQREVIEYKPSLNVKGYKELIENDTAGELLNVVIEKPAFRCNICQVLGKRNIYKCPFPCL